MDTFELSEIQQTQIVKSMGHIPISCEKINEDERQAIDGAIVASSDMQELASETVPSAFESRSVAEELSEADMKRKAKRKPSSRTSKLRKVGKPSKAGGKADKKANRKPRGKKPLKASIIKRLCKMPSDSDALARLAAGGNPRAEVMYTNSQFGQLANPCSVSMCNMCNLAPERRFRSLAKTMSKEKRSPINTKTLPILKRQGLSGSRPTSMVKSLLKIQRSTQERQCLCTELNGHIYKLMDLPAGESKRNSSLASSRRSNISKYSKPRLSTKRKLNSRPSSARRILKKSRI